LAGVTTWAVGPGTARSMVSLLGVRADHVPERHSAQGLVELAQGLGVGQRTFLFPAAKAAQRTLPEGLEALGATLREIVAYETVPDPQAPARLESALAQGLDWLAIASPSAVDALADALLGLGRETDVVSVGTVGPTTARRARERGLSVRAIASPHTMAGLFSAIANACAPESPSEE